MKSFWKSYRIVPLLITLFLVGVTLAPVAFAQSGSPVSLSGDEVCGQWDKVSGTIVNRCGFDDAAKVVKDFFFKIVLALGMPLLVVVLAARILLAFRAAAQGDSGAYKRLSTEAGGALVGFLIIVFLLGSGLYVLLKYGGVKEQFLILLKMFAGSIALSAYAAEGQYLPNPIGVNNLYDFILSILRLVMRFFVYPGLIAMWVWTGFAFVFAQGAPEALAKAKKLLWWAVISTLTIFMLQAFLTAVRGTVNKVLPSQESSQGSSQIVGTPDGRIAPAAGELNAACTTSSGASGQIGAGGVCYPGRGASVSSGSDCLTKDQGTLCQIPLANGTTRTGVCSVADSGRKECLVAMTGDPCLISTGVYGVIDSSRNTCVPITGTTGSSAGGGGGANYDSRVTGIGDVACTRANGGSCRKSGVSGTCVDFTCVTE